MSIDRSLKTHFPEIDNLENTVVNYLRTQLNSGTIDCQLWKDKSDSNNVVKLSDFLLEIEETVKK
jgi:hypothetical protein